MENKGGGLGMNVEDPYLWNVVKEEKSAKEPEKTGGRKARKCGGPGA